MKDAFLRLLQSRKFLMLVLDVLMSGTLFFVGKYAGPSVFEDIQFLVMLLQPVFVSIIVSIAYEDGQEKSNPGLAAS